ncbi:hypothetical protein OK016_20870 [Vibrio chagasii]|nr:hypothetical protein [Vibrio chagasii]
MKVSLHRTTPKHLLMPPVPLVSEDNATYGFPFVTAGDRQR